jgi:hypothetical protein
LLVALLLGCGDKAAKNNSTAVNIDADGSRKADDETLDSVRDVLYTKSDLDSCQGTVRQLNVFLGLHSGQKPEPRPAAQRETFGFDAEEWAEINSNTFTPLDAYYLEECFLLRDVAQGFHIADLPALKKAEAGFDWTVRQVRLRERRNEIVPPAFVLRRGWGTSLQRTHIFLALLQQMKLDGCVVAFLGKEPVTLPGVLVDKEIYLFDSRLGLPLPGAEKGSIATLAQLRAKPELLAALTVDPRHPYDLTPEAIKKAEVLVYYPLAGLAPRMRSLQRWLEPRVKIALAVDPDATAKRLSDAGAAPRMGNRGGDPFSPARALRVFLPREDGGADTPQPIDARVVPGLVAPNDPLQVAWTRKVRYQVEMVPWPALPGAIRGLPPNSELGSRARSVFDRLNTELMARVHEAAPRQPDPADDQAGPPEAQVVRIKMISDEDLPQMMVLRGKTDKAGEHLRKVLDGLTEQRKIRKSFPELDKAVTEWLGQAREAYLRLAQNRDAATRAQVEALWPKSPVTLLCVDALNAPLTAEANFLMALANHERAVRLQLRKASTDQVREAWEDGADGWSTFVRFHGTHPAALAAHRLHAQALEGVGNPEAARAKWEGLGNGIIDNKAAPLTELEKTACLFRAKQLRK